MRQTLRKIVAVLALTGILASFVPSTFAAGETALSAADTLADMGVINSQENASGYNLAGLLLRQESVKIVLGVAGVDYDQDETCDDSSFSDVNEGWVCNVTTVALDAGLIADNATFRPKDFVSQFEALALALRANNIIAIDEDLTVAEVVAEAKAAGIIPESATINTKANASRGDMFKYMVEGWNYAQDQNLDPLCEALGLCADDTDDGETPTGGAVSVSVASTSPNSATVPGSSSGLVVARYTLTAGSDDAMVSGFRFKRVGFGDTNTLDGVALQLSGVRMSKTKNENSSDDTVELNLPSVLTVKAGTSVTIDVLASVGTAAAAGGDEFAMKLLSVASNGAVTINSDTSAMMKVGTIDAAGLDVDADGTTPKVKVGETNKEVRRFKMENTESNEDIMLSTITLKEIGTINDMTEVANWSLFMDGTEVAKTAKSADKYITFNLTTPATLKAGKTHKFIVKADIIGGAGTTIDVVLDNDLDITAAGSKFGVGAAINNATFTEAGTGSVFVEAGELVLSVVEAPSDIIKENKKDVILGKIKVTSATGKNLELQKIAIQIVTDDVSELVSDTFENVELYDETHGTVYDLVTTGAGVTESFADADVNIALPTGVTVFAIRADTKNLTGATATTLAEFAAATYSVSVPNIGSTGFYVVETTDDTPVSDITPSTLSFKNVEGSTAGATVTVLPLSVAKTAVIGSTDVEALTFEIKADNSSALKLTEVVVDGSPSVSTVDNTRVTELKLYKDSISEANLLDRVSGSSIASEKATFDGFNVSIAKNAGQKFIVTASIVDDATKAGNTLQFEVDSIDVDDEDSDDVDPTYSTTLSARILTISGVGTIVVAVDNTDSETDKAKNVLGNVTSPFVASWEITGNNEGIKLKDITIVGSGTSFSNAVAEVILYKADKTTEIARRQVSGTSVTFTGINHVIAQGSENIYAKVVTRKIGKDEAGVQTTDLQLELLVTSADGASSNKSVTVTSYNEVGDQANESLQFGVLPVRISNIAFVNSNGGETVASSLTNGENTVAIIAVTTDSSSNTNSTSGNTLKTELESMMLTVNSDATFLNSTDAITAEISAITVKKIGGTISATTVATGAGAALPAASAGGTALTTLNLFRGVSLGADEEVENGTTVYYVVKATMAGLDSLENKYFQVKLDSLDGGTTVEYSSNSVEDNETYAAGDNITAPRIGTTSLSGPSISSSY